MCNCIDWTSEKGDDGKVTLFGDISSKSVHFGDVQNAKKAAILEELRNIPADIPNLRSKEVDNFISLRANKSICEKFRDEVYETVAKYCPSYKPVKDEDFKWIFDFAVDPDFVI